MNYVDARKKRLEEILDKFKSKLSADELIQILNAGAYIYTQGCGLSYSEVKRIVSETYSKGETTNL